MGDLLGGQRGAGTRAYRLSRLLRGLAGSEPQATRAVPAGATIVRLDEGIAPIASSIEEIGRTWRYRIGPDDRDHADLAFVEIVASIGGDALKPFAPVAVTARRSPQGVTLAWIRRTRRDGHAWEPVEVPLGEETERYEVGILNGSAVLRTLASLAPAVLYPAAQELADFGAPQASLNLSVAQMSAVVGRGFERAVTVAVI